MLKYKTRKALHMYGTSPFQMLLKQQGQLYKIERNSQTISTLDGLPNHEKSTHKQYIGFTPGSDVMAGDCLINSVGERFYVKDTVTDFFMQKPNQLKAFYLTENEFKNQQSASASTVFNIENATGSVIGTQSVVNMNYQTTMQQLHEQVSACNSPDKEQLEKLISMLELITNDDVPAHKGILSKFSAVMERNSWITGSIASAVVSWLTTQPH